MGRAKGGSKQVIAVATRGAAITRTQTRVGSGLSTPELARTLGIKTYEGVFAAVDAAAVAGIAANLQAKAGAGSYKPAKWDNQLFWNAEATASERAQFYAIGNAINFRFWELKEGEVARAHGVINGEDYAGAMYMWRALRASLDDGRVPLLDAEFLAGISDDEFNLIFSDDNGDNPLAVAAEERIANLRDLGQMLKDQWHGQFLNLAEAANGSLVEFARLSATARAFDDPVFKLTMLNAIMLGGSGINSFEDQPLPAIDYHLIRHAVRQGMVIPADEVANKLKAGELLDDEEAEGLRAATLDAYLQLSAQTGLSGEILDNKFWFNRNNCGDPPVCVNPETAAQCPFLDACERHVEYGLPLELTRYY